MSGRVWLTFLTAVVLCALCFRSPHAFATEIPCVSKSQARIFEPTEHVRGWGIRDGSLVKLSVSSDGYWLLTLSPSNMDGAVCIVFMGSDWHFVTSGSTKKEEISD